jgi:ADP-ribose pyrophosphatase YjhB (NUDIX family)
MRPFNFCPACAAEVEQSDDPEELHCPNCGRDWYANMAPTAGAAIVRKGRALATVRAREPEKGKLDVPGGFLGPDEHPLDGLKREVKEELGIAIEAEVADCVQMVPHSYGDDGQVVLSLGFLVRWVAGDPQPADDVADVVWLTPEGLEGADFAWEHDRDLLRRALAQAQG